jgi:type IV secretory pathway TrbD component
MWQCFAGTDVKYQQGESMKANVGGVDRGVRIVVGIVLLALVFVLKSEAGLWLWGLIGIVPVATGLMNWCPAYSLFGMSTCRVKQ